VPAEERSSLANVLRTPRVRGYPAEKPIAVLRQLIAQSSSPGSIVLDPFCGSGNVGRAARQLGRRALLADVDAATAERRLRLTALRPDVAS
jgi:site-specific DNA-methyltransferase (adenine-specific)